MFVIQFKTLQMTVIHVINKGTYNSYTVLSTGPIDLYHESEADPPRMVHLSSRYTTVTISKLYLYSNKRGCL